MYEKTLSHNYCCRGKAISISYSECVFVSLLIRHTAHELFYIVFCGLSESVFFLHYIINSTIFGKTV